MAGPGNASGLIPTEASHAVSLIGPQIRDDWFKTDATIRLI